MYFKLARGYIFYSVFSIDRCFCITSWKIECLDVHGLFYFFFSLKWRTLLGNSALPDLVTPLEMLGVNKNNLLQLAAPVKAQMDLPQFFALKGRNFSYKQWKWWTCPHWKERTDHVNIQLEELPILIFKRTDCIWYWFI